MDVDSEVKAAGEEIYQTFELSDGLRSVTIIASKEEEERIQQDQEYANERFLSALSECSAVDEGDFTHSATLLLIECVRDRFEKFCSSRSHRNEVYREIQEELRSYSYNLSIDKIRNKWSNLVTTYKRIKYRHKASGVGRRVWNYYQQLDEILGPSFESSLPTKISVSTVKNQDPGSSHQQNPVNYEATNSEKLLGASSPAVSCSPQFHSVTPKPFSASVGWAKRNLDGTLNYPTDDSEKEETREELLVKLIQQISENENKEFNYKRKKERRDRMKLRTLQKMVSKLESISKVQEEILRKQDSVIETIIQSKHTSL